MVGSKGDRPISSNSAMTIVRPLKSSTHMVSNVMIEVNGDRAVSECHFLAHHRRAREGAAGEEEDVLKGRYLDRFERRDGAWRIANRTVFTTSSEFSTPPTGLSRTPRPINSGARSPTIPSTPCSRACGRPSLPRRGF